MHQRWIGPVVVFLILGGVASVLLLNLNLKGTNPRVPDTSPPAPHRSSPRHRARDGRRAFASTRSATRSSGTRCGSPRSGCRRCRWTACPQLASSDMIHIEADIHATEGNTNGCPKDEFIPYLTVHYAIVPEGPAAKSVEPIRGTLMPMVARDGWHYGASVPMPRAGRYKLTYSLEPPSAGRHVDPVTGVEPWWKPFEVTFDWDYPGPP